MTQAFRWPLFPSAFVAIVYLGRLSRAFTGVASGATRAALTQHFALENNAADVSAKEGSQETMATMTGMGMLMAHVTGRQPIANDKVLSPLEVSRMEHVFLVWTSWQSSSGAESLHWHVYLAIKASSLKHSDAMELLGATSTHYKRAKYQLLERKGVICVIIHKEATPADILQSYINALVLAV